MFSSWAKYRAQMRAARIAEQNAVAATTAKRDKLRRQVALMGRAFKCGPWKWRIDPKRVDGLGRPMTPEIKITKL